MIKSICNKHSYAKTQYNPIALIACMVKRLYENFRAYPLIAVKSMSKLLMKRHGLVRDLHVTRRARRIILNIIEGKHEECYENLPKYLEILKAANLRLATYIKWEQPEEA